MLATFYIRGQLGYFVLSSAFLMVYLFTMVGIWAQKRNTVRVHENGIAFKNFAASWNEITNVHADPESGVKISKSGGKTVHLSRSISGIDDIAATLNSRLRVRAEPKPE